MKLALLFFLSLSCTAARGAYEAICREGLAGTLVQTSLYPLYNNEIAPCSPEYLNDHQVGKKCVFPGAGFLNNVIAAAIAGNSGNATGIVLEDFRILSALKFENYQTYVRLQTGIIPVKGKQFQAFIASRQAHLESPIVQHVTSSVKYRNKGLDHSALQASFSLSNPTTLDSTILYGRMAFAGLNYGETFRRLHNIQVENRAARGTITLHESLIGNDDPVPPTVLDAAMHLVGAIFLNLSEKANLATDSPKRAAVPLQFDRVLFDPTTPRAKVYHAVARIKGDGEISPTADSYKYELWLYTESGQSVLHIEEGTLFAITAGTF